MDNIDLGTIDVYSDTAPEYDEGSDFLGGLFDTYAMESERERDSDALYESMFASSEPVNTNNRQLNQSVNATMQQQIQIVAQEKVIAQQAFKDGLIESVFNHEGGYSTDRKDTGNWYEGKFVGTNHGVSAPILGEYLGREPTVDDMKALTQETAKEIYMTQYYDKFGIGTLPKHLQEITLNAVVNSGGHGAKVIQKLLGVKEDGVIGPNTRKAMESASFTKKDYAKELLKKYRTFDTWKDHGEGWTNRFNELAE